MVIVSPVRGLRPWRSFLSFTTKLPNPRRSTRSFDRSVSAISSSRMLKKSIFRPNRAELPAGEIIGRAESTTYKSHLVRPNPAFSKNRLFQHPASDLRRGDWHGDRHADCSPVTGG